MLLTHMIDKIRPVRDSPPRQYATHPPLVRTRGGVSDVGGEGGRGGSVLEQLTYVRIKKF